MPHAAEEGGGQGEQHAKPPAKPKPESAISIVMQLPEVQKWQKWVASQKGNRKLSVWGELIKQVDGNACWDIAVGEVTDKDTNVWARFCVEQAGNLMWVESKPNEETGVITYYPYEVWQKRCKPKYDSPGTC